MTGFVRFYFRIFLQSVIKEFQQELQILYLFVFHGIAGEIILTTQFSGNVFHNTGTSTKSLTWSTKFTRIGSCRRKRYRY